MDIDSRTPLDIVQFSLLAPLRHAVSTRTGGVSRAPYDSLNVGYSTLDDEEAVTQNRDRFLPAVGADPRSLMVAHLTHGTEVAVFRGGGEEQWPRKWAPVRRGSQRHVWSFDADAVVSDANGPTFFLTAADCTPLLFWDPERGIIAAAHAGWRGTAGGIALHTIRVMVRDFGSDPGNIRAAVGPSIGPCCYTVGDDVIRTFAEWDLQPVLFRDHATTRLDLWQTNTNQLLSAGLRLENIELACLCTACNLARFYSHRAEAGQTGRMAVAIGLG